MDTRLEDLTAFAQCVARVAQVGPITYVDGVPDIRIGTLAGNLDFLAREAAIVLAKVTAVEIALDEQQEAAEQAQRDLDGPSDAAIERMRDAGGRSSFYAQNMRDAGRGHLL